MLCLKHYDEFYGTYFFVLFWYTSVFRKGLCFFWRKNNREFSDLFERKPGELYHKVEVKNESWFLGSVAKDIFVGAVSFFNSLGNLVRVRTFPSDKDGNLIPEHKRNVDVNNQ